MNNEGHKEVAALIESVEWIQWPKILNSRIWYKELRDKVSAGEFRNTHYRMEHGVSKELSEAAQEFAKNLRDEDDLVNFIGWVNARIQPQTGMMNRFHIPNDENYDMWLRINGLAICINFQDEYGGRGMIYSGGSVKYIDKEGDDATWIQLLNNLTKVAKGEEYFGFDGDFYPYEYC